MSTIRVEGILLQDVMNVCWAMIDSVDTTISGDLEIGIQYDRLGLKLKLDSVAGPILNRWSLSGRRWRVWFDIVNGDYCVRIPNDDNRYFICDHKYYRMADYGFNGDGLDFESDMTLTKMFDLVQPMMNP